MIVRVAFWYLPLVALGRAFPAAAQIGEGLVVQTSVPQDFSRGRNVSVGQTPRPEFNPLGTRVGALMFYPSIQAGVGGTTNTYLGQSGDENASPFVYIEPSARLVTNWSRHFVEISGTTLFRNFIGESRRNERLWDVGVNGRLDVRRTIKVEAEAGTSRTFESLFSGEVDSSVAALSRFRRDFGSVQATYTSGRFRAFALIDRTQFRFADVALTDGAVRDQSDRDRRVVRGTGQIELARTPSVSFFAQLSGSITRYDEGLLRSGLPNLDSRGLRILSGTNLDISGFARGTIGIGYVIRKYGSAAYKTTRGLSIDSRVEFFPTRRTTVTIAAQRAIQDSLAGAPSPAVITRATLSGDYELLENLIISANGSYFNQRYVSQDRKGNGYNLGSNVRYLISRRVGVTGSANYSSRQSDGGDTRRDVKEGRFQVGLSYQL